MENIKAIFALLVVVAIAGVVSTSIAGASAVQSPKFVSLRSAEQVQYEDVQHLCNIKFNYTALGDVFVCRSCYNKARNGNLSAIYDADTHLWCTNAANDDCGPTSENEGAYPATCWCNNNEEQCNADN